MSSPDRPPPTLAELQTLVRAGELACRGFHDYYAVTQPPYLFESSMDESTSERLREIGHRRFPLYSERTQEYLNVSGIVYAFSCCNTLLGNVIKTVETDQATLGDVAYSLRKFSEWRYRVGKPTGGSWEKLPDAVRRPLTESHQHKSQLHSRMEQLTQNPHVRHEINHSDMMERCRAALILLSEIERTESALSKVIRCAESPEWSDLGAKERSAALNVHKATQDLLSDFEQSEGRVKGSVNPELPARLQKLIGDAIQTSVEQSRELFCESLATLKESEVERFDRRSNRFRFMVVGAKAALSDCARTRGKCSQRLLNLEGAELDAHC